VLQPSLAQLLRPRQIVGTHFIRPPTPWVAAIESVLFKPGQYIFLGFSGHQIAIGLVQVAMGVTKLQGWYSTTAQPPLATYGFKTVLLKVLMAYQ